MLAHGKPPTIFVNLQLFLRKRLSKDSSRDQASVFLLIPTVLTHVGGRGGGPPFGRRTCYYGNVRTSFATVLSAFLLLSTPAFAETFVLQAEPALLRDNTAILAANRQSTEGIVEGPGDTLRIFYGSSVPLEGFLAPLLEGGSYNHGDMLYFHLPPSADGQALVDITAIPSWSPRHAAYFLTFVSASEETDAVFREITLSSDNSLPHLFGVILRHFFTPERFRVSSFHLLFGYRILNIPFTVMIGLLLFLAVGCVLYAKRASTALLPTGLATILCFLLLYQARFAVDLGVLSFRHLREWYGQHTYAQAGSMYAIAEEMPRDTQGIVVCFDSTDYDGKLLRYLLSPIPVYLANQSNRPFDRIYVSKKLDWSYEDGILTCGDVHAPAQLEQEFPDGSSLFSLTRP